MDTPSPKLIGVANFPIKAATFNELLERHTVDYPDAVVMPNYDGIYPFLEFWSEPRGDEEDRIIQGGKDWAT